MTDNRAFVLDCDPIYKGEPLGALAEISDRPIDMQVTRDGELLMLEDGAVWQWGAGGARRPYFWESEVIELPGAACPTSARVDTDGTVFRLAGEDSKTFYERTVASTRPFRLKRLGRQRRFRASFRGTGTVELLEFGESIVTMGSEGASV